MKTAKSEKVKITIALEKKLNAKEYDFLINALLELGYKIGHCKIIIKEK